MPLVIKISPNLISDSRGIYFKIIPLSFDARPFVIPLMPFLEFFTGMCWVGSERSRTVEYIGVTSVTCPTTPSEPMIKSDNVTPSLKPLLIIIFFDSLD